MRLYRKPLHADKSPLALADEFYIETEKCWLSQVFLTRYYGNGWYTENYGERPALKHGVLYWRGGRKGKSLTPQCALTMRLTAAPRHPKKGHAGNVYELAGDDAQTLSQLADELTHQSGKNRLPEPERKSILPPLKREPA